jgi:hypothetical protein
MTSTIFFAPETFSSLNAAFDHYPERRAEAIHLLTQTPPHCH